MKKDNKVDVKAIRIIIWILATICWYGAVVASDSQGPIKFLTPLALTMSSLSAGIYLGEWLKKDK